MNRWAERWHTNLLDSALALGMLAFAQTSVWLGNVMDGPRWANAVLLGVAAIGLAWRRTRPVAMTLMVLGGLLVQLLLFGASEEPSGLPMVVIAAYSAASYGSMPWLPLALIAAGLALHDSLDPRVHSVVDALYDFLVCTLAALFGFATKRRATQLVSTELELARRVRQQREVAEAAVAEERARIARELHDIVSHGLGIVVLQAGAAEQVLASDPQQARTALGVIRRTGLDAIEEMGRMLGLMRGESAASRSPEPSLRDLPVLLDRARAGGLDVTLETTGAPYPLAPPIGLSAYRLVQEGLTNALKHAPVKRAHLRVVYDDGWLRLRITNPTSGRSGPGTGRGVPGMRERVSVFDGVFSAGPDGPGQWLLAIDLPVGRAVVTDTSVEAVTGNPA